MPIAWGVAPTESRKTVRVPGAGRRATQVSAIRDALRELGSAAPSPSFAAVLPILRRVLDVDVVVYLELAERLDGWSLETLEADNLSDPARLRRLLAKQLDAGDIPSWFAVHEPHDGRNVRSDVPMPLAELVTRAEYAASSFHARVVAPMGLAAHDLLQLRLTDGTAPAGWLGCFDPKPIGRRVAELLHALVPTLQQRLRAVRAATDHERARAALFETLEQLGTPALLVDETGRIFECNVAGRHLLSAQRSDVAASIAALLARRHPPLPFTLAALASGHHLAVLRPKSPRARIDLAVAVAASRWDLTKRQHEVLARLVHGDSNTDIASALAISLRATEMHVSAIFERAGVDNRSGLVAAVLLGQS